MATAAPESPPAPSLERKSAAQDPTGFELGTDRLVRGLCFAFALLTVCLVAWIVGQIAFLAWPAIQLQGLQFITESGWDANAGKFGVLPEIWGTLYSSILGLLIGSVFGIAVAVFLSEGFLSASLFRFLSRFGLQYHRVFGRIPDVVEGGLRNTIQLLAAIPSVVYGLWGIYVLIPLIRPYCNWIHEHMSGVPFFSTNLGGGGILPAAIVLGIMILPTISAISRDALVAVPPKIREAAYGLGATRWEALLGVIIPTASTGIFGSIILGFGRALGETMALAMLVGNANEINLSVFAPANTLAALLANKWTEATDTMMIGRLMYAALILLAITLVVNVVGTWIVDRANSKRQGTR
jgi:phosphate transport system permease protein